jgi:hypothetical protein
VLHAWRFRGHDRPVAAAATCNTPRPAPTAPASVRVNPTHSDKCFVKHLRINLCTSNLGHFTGSTCIERSTTPEVYLITFIYSEYVKLEHFLKPVDKFYFRTDRSSMPIHLCKGHPLYEPRYVIRSVGNLTKDESCISIYV